MKSPTQFDALEYNLKRTKIIAILGLYASVRAQDLRKKIQDPAFDDEAMLVTIYTTLYESAKSNIADDQHKLEQYADINKVSEEQSMRIEEQELESLLQLL